MPRPVPPHERRYGTHWEEPTHGEIMDALTEIRERLERLEEHLGRK